MSTNKRQRPSPGFYKALNSLSSAELYIAQSVSKKTTLHVSDDLPEGVYKVERLVAERTTVSMRDTVALIKNTCPIQQSQKRVEYLVLWEGYPKEEATWVAKENITSAALRSVSTLIALLLLIVYHIILYMYIIL